MPVCSHPQARGWPWKRRWTDPDLVASESPSESLQLAVCSFRSSREAHEPGNRPI